MKSKSPGWSTRSRQLAEEGHEGILPTHGQHGMKTVEEDVAPKYSAASSTSIPASLTWSTSNRLQGPLLQSLPDLPAAAKSRMARDCSAVQPVDWSCIRMVRSTPPAPNSSTTHATAAALSADWDSSNIERSTLTFARRRVGPPLDASCCGAASGSMRRRPTFFGADASVTGLRARPWAQVRAWRAGRAACFAPRRAPARWPLPSGWTALGWLRLGLRRRPRRACSLRGTVRRRFLPRQGARHRFTPTGRCTHRFIVQIVIEPVVIVVLVIVFGRPEHAADHQQEEKQAEQTSNPAANDHHQGLTNTSMGSLSPPCETAGQPSAKPSAQRFIRALVEFVVHAIAVRVTLDGRAAVGVHTVRSPGAVSGHRSGFVPLALSPTVS